MSSRQESGSNSDVLTQPLLVRANLQNGDTGHQQEFTMHSTAIEAKNRFGSVCAQAKREQVFVAKAGLVDTVILCDEHCQALQASKSRSTLVERKAAFNTEFGDWIDAKKRLG